MKYSDGSPKGVATYELLCSPGMDNVPEGMIAGTDTHCLPIQCGQASEVDNSKMTKKREEYLYIEYLKRKIYF